MRDRLLRAGLLLGFIGLPFFSGCNKRSERGAELKPGTAEQAASPDEPSKVATASATAADSATKALGAGNTPFEYPAVSTPSKAGEYVLAPSRAWIDEAFKRGADQQTFIYYGGWMKEPGAKESLIRTLVKQDVVIPNALIIPIPAAEKVQPLDLVLTSWASGSGMQRAIVVEVSDKRSSDKQVLVRYLDMALDSPSGWGEKVDALPPNTYRKLDVVGELGTTAACKEGKRWTRYIITNKVDDRLLGIGFAGKMKAFPLKDCRMLPISPKLEKGQQVWVPLIGRFVKAKVTRIEPAIGRVYARYAFSGEDREQAFPVLDIALTLPN